MSSDLDECPELISAKVPVTILTGFLGSGKTTLLHYILSADHKKRIAVLVNEFEFGRAIEKGLTVKSSQKPDDEWLELSNGCMCCTAQSQIIKALENLIQRNGTFDLVLVETSGLADPAPVANMFWQDDSMHGSLFLSGILTLVDSKHILKYIKDPELSREITRQLLMADRVIMNKCDISTEEEQQAAMDAIRAINPVADVTKTSFSKLDNLEQYLFLNTTHDLSTLEHIHSTSTGSGESISAVSLEVGSESEPLAARDVREIDFLFRDLLYLENEDTFEVLRAKAAIWISDEAGKMSLYQLQSIGDTFDVTEMAGKTVPTGCSRFLFLGRFLTEEKLREIILRFLKPVPSSV